MVIALSKASVYRTEVSVMGAPTQRSYHDVLGRVIMTEAQSFEPSLWSASTTGFDRLGRTVETTEPYFTTGAGDDLRRCGGTFCTRTSYDDFGRITRVVHVDDKPSRPVVTTTLHALGSCTLQASASSCVSETVTDPKGHTTNKLSSVLGEVVQSKDHLGTTASFGHDAHGNVRLVTQSGTTNGVNQTISTTAVFDVLGRRSSMTEPNSGTRSTTYNAAGEAITEVDANGQCVSSRFDVMGRMVARSDYKSTSCSGAAESSASWQYDLGANGKGKLTSESDSASQLSRTPSYDSLSRPNVVVQTIEGKTYRQETTFDAFGRTFQSFDLILPAGDAGALNNAQARKVGVQNVYNSIGFQTKVVNAQNSADVFLEILETNARGQIINDRRAGNVALSRSMSFDSVTGRLMGIKSGVNGSIQDLDYGLAGSGGVDAGYDVLGNLQFRKDLRTSLSETFGYDALNRITSTSVTASGKSVVTNFSYDAFGNFRTKGNQTQVTGSYTGITNSCARQSIGPNMLGGINIGGAITAYCYDNNGNQINAGLASGSERVLTYAVHDKPLSVRTAGSNTSYTAYTYGTGREIVSRKEGANITNLDRLTHYVGGMEVTYRPDSGVLTERREFRRYLSNFLVITMNIERNNGAVVKSSTRRYRFEEKLGSLDVLTDAAGTVVQRMSFDVWGQRRSDSWGVWSTAQVASFDNKETRKGYTGHEMLDASNLIHMGGRMYDPMVGKFLSADILVQAPFNSQSHNRYSYVMNNPMNYTDPSGYAWIDSNWRTVASIAINFFLPGSGLVGAANGLLAKVITGMISGAVQTGSLKGALTGGFGAAMFHGIGQKFSDLAEANAGKSGLVKGTASYAGKGGLTGPQFAAKIAAHATAGGVMGVLNGGKFGHGFASAGLVEAVNPALAGLSEPSMIAASIVVGGTSSVIAGGKFANGAVTASFQLAFNHGLVDAVNALDENIDKLIESLESTKTERIWGGAEAARDNVLETQDENGSTVPAFDVPGNTGTQCSDILQHPDTFGAPLTRTWAPGREVKFGVEIPYGTAIARFVDGAYSSNHAAVYLGQDASGVYVLDQWASGSGGGRLHYRVLEWDNPDFTNSGRGFSTAKWSQRDKE